MTVGDRTIDEVAAALRLGRRTLDGWLAADLLRAPDDRRFQFHTRRGRKRIWSESAFQLLKAAIERESAPGGVLAGRNQSNGMVTGMPSAPFVSTAARSALDEVLAWPSRPQPRTKPRRQSMRLSTRSRRASPARSGVVTPYRSRRK